MFCGSLIFQGKPVEEIITNLMITIQNIRGLSHEYTELYSRGYSQYSFNTFYKQEKPTC